MQHLPANLRLLIGAGLLVLVLAGLMFYFFPSETPTVLKDGEMREAEAPLPVDDVDGAIENGIHTPTGLIASEGVHLVIAHCTACHSAKLVTQNRADREGWEKMIRWMQQTQNLWDLGEQEVAILDYLAENYAPVKSGRRPPLTDIDWYELKD
ncbi:hypothetical protein SAMN05192553_103757 [Cyclobacterium xiamenense]|uniref:Sulfite dehydrogenase (Cytochrome) subunit SorB n=1 Tax=Cyclobacterium xiamenense TaxID=1297121 RepID=A0A1H6YIU9_9BACT|nr:hypothetical protein [Cyclobacterium xiamenense]SEJ41209.1 hypothetical protein SAMN05192553_103757 [Cyclobacterium xiamenense]